MLMLNKIQALKRVLVIKPIRRPERDSVVGVMDEEITDIHRIYREHLTGCQRRRNNPIELLNGRTEVDSSPVKARCVVLITPTLLTDAVRIATHTASSYTRFLATLTASA